MNKLHRLKQITQIKEKYSTDGKSSSEKWAMSDTSHVKMPNWLWNRRNTGFRGCAETIFTDTPSSKTPHKLAYFTEIHPVIDSKQREYGVKGVNKISCSEFLHRLFSRLVRLNLFSLAKGFSADCVDYLANYLIVCTTASNTHFSRHFYL